MSAAIDQVQTTWNLNSTLMAPSVGVWKMVTKYSTTVLIRLVEHATPPKKVRTRQSADRMYQYRSDWSVCHRSYSLSPQNLRHAIAIRQARSSQNVRERHIAQSIYAGSECAVGCKDSVQPPWSMDTSLIIAPGDINLRSIASTR